MLPIRVLRSPHSPVRGHRGRPRLGGRVSAHRFSPSRVPRLPVSSFQRAILRPRLAVSLLWRLLTSQGISSSGSPQIRACCFPIRPPHLPPWLNQRALLCCASSPATSALYAICRSRCSLLPVGQPIVLRTALSVSPQVSASLPPHARLPLRSWLHVVVSSYLHVMVLLQGTFTPFTTRPCWAYTTE